MHSANVTPSGTPPTTPGMNPKRHPRAPEAEGGVCSQPHVLVPAVTDGLLEAPEVNGNWQMKISPNISAQGLVNRVLSRIVSHELLVSASTPFCFLGISRRENYDAGLARSWQSCGNLPGDWQHRGAI
jgi:hypothetical protein